MANYEALLLPTMRQENRSFTFYEKTYDLCKMHKNQQISVDIIRDLCFHVGMDAREMKKRILLFALSDLQTEALGSEGGAFYQLATYILDKEVADVTNAEYNRFLKVLDEMVANAMSKI